MLKLDLIFGVFAEIIIKSFNRKLKAPLETLLNDKL